MTALHQEMKRAADKDKLPEGHYLRRAANEYENAFKTSKMEEFLAVLDMAVSVWRNYQKTSNRLDRASWNA